MLDMFAEWRDFTRRERPEVAEGVTWRYIKVIFDEG